MTDKNLNNGFNNPDTEYKTELTLKVQVSLPMDGIRELVHLWDKEMCGGDADEAIAPEHVTAQDWFALWMSGNFNGDVQIVADEMGPLT
jgi:hypothetical protein